MCVCVYMQWLHSENFCTKSRAHEQQLYAHDCDYFMLLMWTYYVYGYTYYKHCYSMYINA